MNLFKKMMTGVAVGALTLAIAGGVGSADVSAASSGPDVTVDPAAQTLTVGGKSTNEVMVAYPTVKNGVAKAVKSWDVYEGAATIDVSNLNATKDNYVMVKTDESDDVAVIKFAAVPSKIKATYNGSDGKMAFTGAPEGMTLTYEYRTAAGAWDEYSLGDSKDDPTDLSRFEMTGSTVYFRTVSSIVELGKNDEAETFKIGDDTFSVATTAYFGGKEIKAKITKRANGPKANVNLDAQTFTLAKDCLYRNANSGEWKEGKAKDAVIVDASAAGVFEVKFAKTENTDPKKAKPESKITQYAYAAAKTVTLNETKVENKGEVSLDIKDQKVMTSGEKDAKDALTFKYQAAKKATDTSYAGIEIVNSDDVEYQVYIGTAVDDVAKLTDAKTYKPTKVAAGKTVKVAASKIGANSVVYVRYASNKKTSSWASAYVLAGKVDLTIPTEED